MDYIEFDQKKAYAFTEKFESDTIKKIKQEFQKKCKANQYRAFSIKFHERTSHIYLPYRSMIVLL